MNINVFKVHFFVLVFTLSISGIHCSFWDTVPLVSQAKSFIQYLSGDSAAAKETQHNFSRKNLIPIVPIIRSSIEALRGDSEGARETWRQNGKMWESVVDSLPVVGHAKGGVHYALGDTERGHQIMKSATRPVGVIAGGAGGMMAGGPAGAVVGGIAGGGAMDGIITGIESAIEKKYKPHGHIHAITKIVNGEAKAGDIFDSALNVVGDGIGGYAAGRTVISPKSPSAKTGLVGCRRRRRRGLGTVYCGYHTQPSNIINLNQANLPRRYSGSSVSSGGIPAPSGMNTPSLVNSPVGSFHSMGGVGSASSIRGAGLPTSQIVLPIIAAGAANRNTDNDGDEDKKQEKIKRCAKQPEIENRDKRKMENCKGKKADEECDVECSKGFHPTQKKIKCVTEGDLAKWNLLNIRCEPDVVCRDENNLPVDWFIVSRIPKASSESSEEIPYIYLTGNILNENLNGEQGNQQNPNFAGWKYGRSFRSNDRNPIYNTLQTIMGQTSSTAAYLMYNDHPPNRQHASTQHGHAKGVVAYNELTGFYMPHSLPKFPDRNGRGGSDKFGQTFMCITVNSQQPSFNDLLEYIYRLRPNVYYIKDDPRFENPYRLNMFRNPTWRTEVANYDVIIPSISGLDFRFFAKPDPPTDDIYSSIISPAYGVNMSVLSWALGSSGTLRPICDGITVENIVYLFFDNDFLSTFTAFAWDINHEHSKWAVSNFPSTNPFFCIGDTNRQESQKVRYGGAVCMQHRGVVQSFTSLVISTDCLEGPLPRWDYSPID